MDQDTERLAREFWESEFKTHRLNGIEFDSCARCADAALIEWRKRFGEGAKTDEPFGISKWALYQEVKATNAERERCLKIVDDVRNLRLRQLVNHEPLMHDVYAEIERRIMEGK